MSCRALRKLILTSTFHSSYHLPLSSHLPLGLSTLFSPESGTLFPPGFIAQSLNFTETVNSRKHSTPDPFAFPDLYSHIFKFVLGFSLMWFTTCGTFFITLPIILHSNFLFKLLSWRVGTTPIIFNIVSQVLSPGVSI